MRARLFALSILLSLSSTWPGDCGLAHHPAHQTNHNDPSTTTPSPEEDDDITPASRVHKAHKDTCTKSAECVLPVQCPAHVNEEEVKQCSTAGGREGVCCTTGKNHTAHTHHKGRGHHVIHVDAATLGLITRHSRVEMAEMHMREARILSTGRSAIVPLGTASYGHFRNSRMFSTNELEEVLGVANRALEIALATRAFKDRRGITNQEIEFGMINQNLRPTPLGSACPTMPPCPEYSPRHRRIDAACNNLQNPRWGMALTPYSRLLPPSYQDGVWSPRVSEDQGQPLNSPRTISSTLFYDQNHINPHYTLMLMQFGQFLSHEVTQSIDTSFPNGSAVSCCTEDGSSEVPQEFRHYACMPITISPKDNFFAAYGQGCMNFVRSVLSPRYDCTMGFAQQMNKVTHFIDGSAIYGSNSEQTGELRSFEGGRLRVFQDFGRELPPLSDDADACLTMERGSACFTTGDTRANQMISLVVIHTIFIREHNRVSGELQRLNPHWNDEELFLEARRIVVAEMQVVIYKEFLPALLGDIAMDEFDLALQPEDKYSFDYNPRVEPSIINEFASAAYRFGHSTVEGVLKMYGRNKMEEAIDIPEVMFHPARMRKREFYDQMLSTPTTEPIQDVDNVMADALTKYMFRAGNPFGVDLAAINIQRGRDHGLRPYNDYRELVGQTKIKSFDEFGEELGRHLHSVYASVDDIDLWVGGLLEPKYAGSILGMTFRDIIAEQFSRLRIGDKYFFEHDPSVNPGHFTPEQLQELRKASMSRMICDNRDGTLILRQAPNAFRTPGVPGNEFVDCIHSPVIPRVNLRMWQDI